MPERFSVRLTCCGRDDGRYLAETWQEADKFREAYLSGPGVFDPKYPERGGHNRSAIIEAWPWVTTG